MKTELVHWPECTNNPCTCADSGSLLFVRHYNVKTDRLPTLFPIMYGYAKLTRPWRWFGLWRIYPWWLKLRRLW